MVDSHLGRPWVPSVALLGLNRSHALAVNLARMSNPLRRCLLTSRDRNRYSTPPGRGGGAPKPASAGPS